MEGIGFRLTPRLFIGLCLIALGSLWALDNANVLNAHEYLRFWPLAFVVLGVVRLIQPGCSKGVSLLFILGGGVLLVHELNLLPLSPQYLFPFFLMVVGGWIVLRSVFGARLRASGADSGSTLSNFALLAGVERKNTSPAFRGGDVTAIMGGAEIDLRGASITDGPAVIEVFAMWGGIDIIVPVDWTVAINVTPILGGCEDARKSPTPDPAKQLVVQGVALMGGVEIRN